MGYQSVKGCVLPFLYSSQVALLALWKTITFTNLPLYVVLSELESCSFRNRSPDETIEYMTTILAKHLPLRSTSSKGQTVQEERKKDHYSHFILRLAFSSTEDLRRRFSRLETMLFRLRFKSDDMNERKKFVSTLNLEWEEVGEDEKRELGTELRAAGHMKKEEEQEWFKVDWERVPELVEQRRVLVKRGKAFVPQREQLSLVVAEFTKRLDEALEVRFPHITSRVSMI